MKWSKIEYLKTHCRIDYDCEDALLEQYANAAEEFILKYTNRTYENVIDLYGSIPARLYDAVQLLVDTMYENRSIVTITNMSVVPYSFDAMISDFVRHTKETPLQSERNTLLDNLCDVETDLNFDYAELASPTDEQTEAYKNMLATIAAVKTHYSSYDDPTKKICTNLRTRLATIKTTCEHLFDVDEEENVGE